MFDVAVNHQTVIRNLDIWKEAGFDHALKKTINVHVADGQLKISFPETAAGEAIISAIAISTLNHRVIPAASSGGVIENFKAEGFVAKKWSLQHWMDIGDTSYTDATICFSQLPPALFGADWIKSPEHISAKPIAATFTVNKASDVYVAINAKPKECPVWMKGFLPAGLSLQTDENGGTTFSLYKKRFTTGTPIVLGPCTGGERYTVAVLPITTLAPAIDLKKTISYKVAEAAIAGGVTRDTMNNKRVLRFTKPAGGKIIFKISAGVADKYALRLKYHNGGLKTLTATMQLQAADGTILETEALNFKPVRKNKTGTVATTTGTSINAGNYEVILTASDAEGLIITGLEMQ
jgi:hypothetical protein